VSFKSRGWIVGFIEGWINLSCKLIRAFSKIAWPFVTLFLFLYFSSSIKELLSRCTSFDGLGVSIKAITSEEAQSRVNIIGTLTQDKRTELSKMYKIPELELNLFSEMFQPANFAKTTEEQRKKLIDVSEAALKIQVLEVPGIPSDNNLGVPEIGVTPPTKGDK
jgi:hypothetical protein